MPKKQPTYDEEFRRDSLEFYRTSTLPKKQIARELGVSSNTLREWDKRDRQAHGGGAGTAAPEGAAGAGADPVRLARRLSLEIQQLRRREEILKKAAVIITPFGHALR